jgi:hypothetical protein
VLTVKIDDLNGVHVWFLEDYWSQHETFGREKRRRSFASFRIQPPELAYFLDRTLFDVSRQVLSVARLLARNSEQDVPGAIGWGLA